MRADLKGTALEKAVEGIEGIILRAFPGYDEKTFRIARRKIVTVSGVKHEFDIWVEIDLGKGYRSLFVFECRNRVEKVDKNDIIILSVKAQAVSAQSAFFVARGYTKDAEAQAATDPRMKLLLARDLPSDEIDEWLHTYNPEFVGINRKNISINMEATSSARSGTFSIPVQNAQATLGGCPIDLAAYQAAWLEVVCDAHTQKLGPGLPDGIYPAALEDTRTYQPGEFVIGTECIRKATVRLEIDVHVASPHIVSAFEVGGRGRALIPAPFEFLGGQIHWMLVGASDDAG